MQRNLESSGRRVGGTRSRPSPDFWTRHQNWYVKRQQFNAILYKHFNILSAA